MLPPAPPLLSTMNCCENAWVNAAAVARARMSVVPPGAKGTTIFTGLAGHADWARPGRATAAAASASSERRGIEGNWVMAVSLGVLELGRYKQKAARRRPIGWCVQASVGVDAGGLDDGAPLGDLGGDELLVLGRLDAVVGHDDRAQAFLLLDELGVLQGDLQRIVQSL